MSPLDTKGYNITPNRLSLLPRKIDSLPAGWTQHISKRNGQPGPARIIRRLGLRGSGSGWINLAVDLIGFGLRVLWAVRFKL